MTLQISKAESLYYEIKLMSQPVRTKEAEILAERPEEVRSTLFFPKESPDMYCIYGTSSSIPIGILFTDSAFYMFSLGTDTIQGEKYIRVWLLYKNLSQSPYNFNPIKCVRLSIREEKYSYNAIQPELSSHILSALLVKRDYKIIHNEISKPLEAMATKHSLYLNKQSHFELLLALEDLLKKKLTRYGYTIKQRIGSENDKPLKNYPSTNGSLSSQLYMIFNNSINVGVLNDYTVYPNNSINGFIYFPFPGLNWKATGEWFYEAAKYEYELEIVTPDGSKTIEFRPN
ncbi:MAG: hypothetical protein HY800_03610 [Ignavibacteriales bacterium]|nr:hypothetical protein [Ignavibacteriales bacterium]